MHTNSLTTDIPQDPRGSGYFRIAFAAIARLLGLLSCLAGLRFLAEAGLAFLYTPALVQATTLTSETQGYIVAAVFLSYGLVFTYAGAKLIWRNFRIETTLFRFATTLPMAALLLSTMPLVGFGMSNAFC